MWNAVSTCMWNAVSTCIWNAVSTCMWNGSFHISNVPNSPYMLPPACGMQFQIRNVQTVTVLTCFLIHVECSVHIINFPNSSCMFPAACRMQFPHRYLPNSFYMLQAACGMKLPSTLEMFQTVLICWKLPVECRYHPYWKCSKQLITYASNWM